MKIVFATHNSGKVKEMQALLADLDLEVMSADEAGVTEDVIEDGETFEENAIKKARFVNQKTHTWVVSDDSGVCIKALGCAPGVLTARWAGEGATDEKLVAHTLEQLKGMAEGERQAWFESCVAIISPEGELRTFTGRVDGHIPLEPRGANRPKLPYDVIFIPNGHDRTFAEMSDEEKNALSHRGRAFQQMKEYLKSHISYGH